MGRRWKTSSSTMVSLSLLLFLAHFATMTQAADQGQQDPLQCLAALTSVEGCFNAVHRAVLDRSFRELGQPCCQAVTGLGDYCWPIIFPCRPLVPFLLKTICKFVPTNSQIHS